MKLPQKFIDDLRERADIVDVVGGYVPLRKAGINYTACCPFHDEKSPSFTVSAEKQFYHCFGCGAHGDVFKFLVEYCGLSFRDAIGKIAQQQGQQLPPDEPQTPMEVQRNTHLDKLQEVLARAKDTFRNNLRLHPHAIAYMKERGLTKESVNQFGLGYAHQNDIVMGFGDLSPDLLSEAGLVVVKDETGEMYDRYRRRIVFPIHNEKGVIIGFGGRVLNDADKPKYINSPETPLFQKSEELFGLYYAKPEIRKGRTALLMEGYMDVIMMHQHGDPRSVATMGTSMTARQLARLYRICDEAIFCFDGDRAGLGAADRAARMVLEAMEDGKSARFLTIPDGHDPDSYVRSHGIDEWLRCVEEDSIPLSTKLMELLVQGRNMALPEDRAAVAKDAGHMLATIANAPTFAAAMKSHIETALGFTLGFQSSKPTPTRQGVASAAVAPAAPVDRSMSRRPDDGKRQFYLNYALLCGLDKRASASVPVELVDDHARHIAAWFASAPESLEARFERIAGDTSWAGQIIVAALHGIKDRFALLPESALAGEINAIQDAIGREAGRQQLATLTSSLFN